MDRQLRFVDLFAGIGGFHQALSSLAVPTECVLAVEIDPACRRVYSANWPGTQLVENIRSITQLSDGSDKPKREIKRAIPDHDVLCAGFPCQPFSKSGAQLGVRDETRGTLFHDIMQVIEAKKPQYVVLENVRNLTGPRHAATLEAIVWSLQQAGYVVPQPIVYSPHLLPPELGGAPQVRERVFIVAEHREGASPNSEVADLLVENRPLDHWDPSCWRVESVLDDDSDIENLDRYQLRPEERGWIDAWNAFVKEIPTDHLPGFPIWADYLHSNPAVPPGAPRWKEDFIRKNAEFYAAHHRVIDKWRRRRWGPHGQTLAEFPPSRRKLEWQARSWQPAHGDRDLWDLVLHLRPSGIRVKPPTYLPALVAIAQTPIVGPRKRRITPQEAARLQSMSPTVLSRASVDDATAYRQLGNAVNVGVARFVISRLLEASNQGWEIPSELSACVSV